MKGPAKPLRLLTVAATLAGLIGADTTSVQAHRADFDACAAYKRSGRPCISGREAATYTPYSGSGVHLRGRVSTSHAGLSARVARRAPGGSWQVVGQDSVSSGGRLYWRWAVTESDVDYDGPYRLVFRIPGHGRSNVVKVYVIYGE